MIVEDNSLYKLNHIYTDRRWIDHYKLIFEWKEYTIRMKKKSIDDFKVHVIKFVNKYRKNKHLDVWEDMPFKMWLKTFKWLYY